MYYRHVILDRNVENLDGNASALTLKATVLVMPECLEPVLSLPKDRVSMTVFTYGKTSIRFTLKVTGDADSRLMISGMTTN